MSGCAGSEPTQDAATTEAELEASTLVGHRAKVLRKLDLRGRAKLGDACDAVGSVPVDPDDYFIADVGGLDDGVEVTFRRKADASPSRWSIQCFAEDRRPRAHEIVSGVRGYLAIDAD